MVRGPMPFPPLGLQLTGRTTERGRREWLCWETNPAMCRGSVFCSSRTFPGRVMAG